MQDHEKNLSIFYSGAKSKDREIPPSLPTNGDIYIIGGNPRGEWIGHAREIAYFTDMWLFITPVKGMTLNVNDEDRTYIYNGVGWETVQ